MAWKNRHGLETRPAGSLEGVKADGAPEASEQPGCPQRPLSQVSSHGVQGGVWLNRNARDDLQHCSDLLEELLEALRQMETEYRVSLEGPPDNRVTEAHAEEHGLDVA